MVGTLNIPCMLGNYCLTVIQLIQAFYESLLYARYSARLNKGRFCLQNVEKIYFISFDEKLSH